MIAAAIVAAMAGCGPAQTSAPPAAPAPCAGPIADGVGRASAEPVVPAAASAASSASAGPPAAPSPRGPVDELRDRILATSQALDTVRSLTDRAGPRRAGSRGGELAVAWGVERLRAAGLGEVRAEPLTVPHWDRGAESGAIVAPVPHALALAALGGSVGTPKGGLEAEVIEVASLEAIDALDPAQAKGKIVFVNRVTERRKDGHGYGEAVPVRGLAAIHAAKRGAAGVVIRSIGTDHDRVAHTGAMRYEDGVAKIPAAALSIPDAELLHRLAAAGAVRLRMSLGARQLPEARSANVVGDVTGSGAPGEIVLLGAHLDSWDLGTGAIDDGAGCAIVIEAARQIAAMSRRPRRTVLVVLFANEENGLAGAKAYAKEHEAELGRHVAAIEADFGDGAPYAVRFLGGRAGGGGGPGGAGGAAPLGVLASDEEAEGGADLIPLRRAGVPVIDVLQDGTRYFDLHHTANDTFDKIDKEALDRAAAAYAAVAFAVADSPADLGRIPEAKRQGRH